MSRAAAVALIAPTLMATACGSPQLAATSPPVPTASLQTSTPAATAAAIELPQTGTVAPGRYFVDAAGYRYTFTVSGTITWDRSGQEPDVLIRHDAERDEHGVMWLWGPLPATSSLYRDPCHVAGTEFTPGPSVDDYASALTTIDTWQATIPIDVTVGGRHGKRVQLTVPADQSVSECDGYRLHLSADRWYQRPGQTDDQRILDFDGARYLILTTWFSTTPAEIQTQLNQMVDSLEIDKL